MVDFLKEKKKIFLIDFFNGIFHHNKTGILKPHPKKKKYFFGEL